MQKTPAVVCTPVLLICVLGSCACGRHLSRSRAAELLHNSQAFNRQKTVSILTGNSIDSVSIFEPEYPALHSLGLIAIGGPLHLNWIFLKGLDISLTEDGSRESLKWKKKSSGFWELPIGTRQLNEVTGIRDLESGKAQVEFSWSWTPNRIGEQLAKAVDESNASEQEFLRKEQQAYEQQLDRNKVDRLQRLQLDLNRQQYVSRVTQLQALWVGGKKLDKSRVFKSIIEFWLYDDGWRPAPKGDQSLREALDVAEKAAG